MQGCGHPDLQDIPFREQSVNEKVCVVVPQAIVNDCRMLTSISK